MIPLTIEENKPFCKQKVCYICIKEFRTNNAKTAIKLYSKNIIK